MRSSLKLVLVALVSAVLTGGAVYTYFRTAARSRDSVDPVIWRTGNGGVPVVIDLDSSVWEGNASIRLDVRDGLVAEGEKLIPLAELAAYVDAAVAKRHVRYLVVNTPITGKFGEVVGVVDRCRKCRLEAIVLNSVSLDEAYDHH